MDAKTLPEDSEWERLARIPGEYAEPDVSIVAKLPKGGDKGKPKVKCAVCDGYHFPGAVHLDFVGHGDITLMLITVDPLWSWDAKEWKDGAPVIGAMKDRLVLWGTLTVCGKTLPAVGTCELGKSDPEKELIGDLLRNGAMRFGFCTKLWSKTAGMPGQETDPPPPAEKPAQHREEHRSAPATAPKDTARTPPRDGGAVSGQTQGTPASRLDFQIPGKGRLAGKNTASVSISDLENQWRFERGRIGPEDGKYYSANCELVERYARLLEARTGLVHPLAGEPFDQSAGGSDEPPPVGEDDIPF